MPQRFIGMLTFLVGLPSDPVSQQQVHDWRNELQQECPVAMASYAFSEYTYDAVWAVARALDTVQQSNDSPGSATFQRALRKQLFLSNFTGITGAFSLTQCTGVDYTLDSLGLNSMNNTCGDREQRYRDLYNFAEWEGGLKYQAVSTGCASLIRASYIKCRLGMYHTRGGYKDRLNLMAT